MKNISFSVDERLIEAAWKRARTEHTTLDEEFRRWLEGYAQETHQPRRYDELMNRLRGKLVVGRRLGRDGINER